MKKIFIASHGKLASGFKSSLEVLLGSAEKVTIFDAYLDDSNFESILISYLENQSKEDQILLLSDLYGGSVNQIMARYTYEESVLLIAGVNLAFILEIVAQGDNHISKNDLNEIIKNSREALKLVELEAVPEQDNFF